MHSFEVHSNESACRKSGSLGMDQVSSSIMGKEVREQVDYEEEVDMKEEYDDK